MLISFHALFGSAQLHFTLLQLLLLSRDGVTRWIFFGKSKHFIRAFCVRADGFQGLSKAFQYPTQKIINFLFASLKSLPNFENTY
jgi:hypothetical protein